ncbi:hypothetical protein [Streptomyces cadmiisoli]|uniref:hypothetical protein n=1 Tax=Streptomyces cadmiisoli TaxID=2184053 RepID=UPI0036642445
MNIGPTVCGANQHAAEAVKRRGLQKEPPDGIFVEPADRPLQRRSFDQGGVHLDPVHG